DFTRIFRDDEIDLSFPDAQKRFPQISTLELKKHTYASLIYSWLRCPYAHEYCTVGSTTHVPASHQPARVSYIGRRFPNGNASRIASFHIDYLISLASFHAEHVTDTAEPL